MIHPETLYRLVMHLVDGVRMLDGEPMPDGAQAREALIDFAGQHDLDTQDTATLYAVAAGAGLNWGPPMHTEEGCPYRRQLLDWSERLIEREVPRCDDSSRREHPPF